MKGVVGQPHPDHAHRPDQDDLAVRVPVVAAVRRGPEVRYVRLGQQFCVKDRVAARKHL